ncbi:MAG: hypothetical protein ACYCRF_01875 [Acidithiobacillus sp.]
MDTIFDDALARPCATEMAAEPPPFILDFQHASGAIRAALTGYLNDWIKWRDAMEKYNRREKLKELGKGKKTKNTVPRPKILPMLLQSTTGGGKTLLSAIMIALAQQYDIPILIVVANHKLAEEFEAKLAAMGVKAFRYFGRQPSVEKWNEEKMGRPHPGSEWVCQKIDVIKKLSDKNQRPAQALCKNCEFGMKNAWDNADHREDDITSERIQKWFIEHKIKKEDFGKIGNCDWLRSLEYAMQQPVVIIPIASFSQNMTEQHLGPGKTAKRLVTIDESAGLGSELNINHAAIKEWLSNIADENIKLDEILEKPLIPEDREKIETRKKGLAVATDVFRVISGEIGIAADRSGQLSESTMIELRGLQANYGATLLKAGTAGWERVVRGEGIAADYTTPLRAASAILACAKAGAIKIDKMSVVAYEISPWIQFLISGNQGGILMDATPSIATVSLFKRVGGRIEKILMKQNISLIRHPVYSFGRGKTFDRELSRQIALEKIDDIRTLINLNFANIKTSDEVGVITHKLLIDVYKNNDMSTPPDVQAWGWWGKHHIGTDIFKHRPLCIFGVSLPHTDALKTAYSIDRAALIQAGIEWPEWDETIGLTQKDKEWLVEQPGGPPVRCYAPLPSDPVCRAWMLDYILIDVVQAIGRVRGASWPRDKPPIEVHVFGGLPLIGLDQHLIEISEYRNERLRPSQPDAVRSVIAPANALRAADRAIRAAALQPALRAAASQLTKNYTQITYRKLKQMLMIMKVDVPDSILRNFLTSLHDSGIDKSKGGR